MLSLSFQHVSQRCRQLNAVRTSLLLAALAMGAMPATGRAAGLLLDAGGFESFTAGNVGGNPPGTALDGQQGWVRDGAGASTGNVTDGVGVSGSKGVEVRRAPNTASRWVKPVTPITPQRFVVIDWDMRVLASTGGASAFGPYFAVEAYDAQGGFGQVGSLGVDAKTGDVLYQQGGTGALIETGSVVGFDTWNHFQMVLDYSTDLYHVFVNNTKLGISGFIDSNLNEFTDADIAVVPAAPDSASQAIPGTAFYDNFTIRDGVAGDFDADGDVDGADLTTWKGAVGVNANGNTDGDGDSDGADFLIWQRNVGQNVLRPIGTTTAVPEPSAILAALTGIAALAWRRLR